MMIIKRAHWSGRLWRWLAVAACGLAVGSLAGFASTYGTLNNFDTVNTGDEPAHGFEIELEDCHSADITHTYNYNHYGVPRIFEDDSVPEHTICYVRWESGKNTDGSWAAYTAVPDGPIDPTNGHHFTNPNLNFGGEHFGVGIRGNPTKVRYFWLVDNGAGELIRGNEVQVATPKFTYVNRQVRAVIEPVEPPEQPVREFGEPVWVKSIKTTSHNNHEVKLRDLVSDDPDDPDDRNWRNSEPDEVEMEWEMLQTEFGKENGGGRGQLESEPEELAHGDEVVTRRWEFFEYTGPLDPENGEALAERVAPDGRHGVGTKTAAGQVFDLANTVVVGRFLGAQMSALDPDAEVDLVEHLQDGEVGVPYPERTVVIGGSEPFTAVGSGDLPAGLEFEPNSGVLSGVPTEAGEFAFTVEASDPKVASRRRTYHLRVAPAGVALPPHSEITTTVEPADAGTATGDGAYDNGNPATVTATANPGFRFVHWTDHGVVVGTAPNLKFPVQVNRDLVAHFEPVGPALGLGREPDGGLRLSWPSDPAGWTLQEAADPVAGPWTDSALPVVDQAGDRQVRIEPAGTGARFFRLIQP